LVQQNWKEPTIATVTHRPLSNTASLQHRLDTNLELLDIVQGIEDTENVNTMLLRLLAKVEDGIIWKGGVRDTVSTTQQHLERDVGDRLAELLQPVPRVFEKETHRDVKGGTTPALKRPGIAESVAGLGSDVEHVDCPHPGGEERLVSVTPSSVHDQAAFVRAHGLCESRRTLLDEDVPPASLAWRRDIVRFAL